MTSALSRHAGASLGSTGDPGVGQGTGQNADDRPGYRLVTLAPASMVTTVTMPTAKPRQSQVCGFIGAT